MELLDVFDKKGKFVGVMERELAHSKDAGVYHKAVHIWLVNDKGEVLVQKMSPNKKNHPNQWDIPSAGHVDSGEDLITACKRETLEELGINLAKKEFKFQCQILNSKGWEFSEQYLVFNNTKIEDMILQKEEVAEVKWLSLKAFKDLLYSDKFVPHLKEYKDKIYSFIELQVNEITKRREDVNLRKKLSFRGVKKRKDF